MHHIPTIVNISNLDIRGVEPYRTLRRQEAHLHEGIFVAEGEKVVRRLFSSGLKVRSMLLTPEWFGALFPEGPGGGDPSGFIPGAVIYIAPKALLEKIVGVNLHQGVMAVAEAPLELTADELIATAIASPRLMVALDDLVNAENVGLVARNCSAFGVDALICGETSSNPYLRRAVRASMGTVFGLAIHISANLAGTLTTLASRAGVTTIAADPAAAESIYSSPLHGSLCIVLGHEGSGIRPAVLAACQRRVAIPMWKGTDSLNVSSACAVFLSEARRRHDPSSA